MAHDAQAAGLVDQVGFKADQAARGDQRFDADLVAVVLHSGDFGLAAGEVFHDRPHVFLGNFQKQPFDRLKQVAVLCPCDK